MRFAANARPENGGGRVRRHYTLPGMGIYGRDRDMVGRGQALMLSAACCLCAVLATYLLDPERGRRRCNMLRDRSLARARRIGRAMSSMVRGAVAETAGVSHRIVHLVPRSTEIPDDETLCQRVESQLFRDRHIPKGELNISCEH